MEFLVRLSQTYESYALVAVEAEDACEAVQLAQDPHRIVFFDGLTKVAQGVDKVWKSG